MKEQIARTLSPQNVMYVCERESEKKRASERQRETAQAGDAIKFGS